MPRSPHPEGSRYIRAAAAIIAAAVLGSAGCAIQRPKSAGPAPTPAEVYGSLFGFNTGLTSVRAVVEARLSFAGREVSLPGVLLLDTLGGFRLELLDPLDRPLAILFPEVGRSVHYRPGPGLAASLGVFPEGCRGVDPADWVSVVLSSSVAPVDGEILADRSLFWSSERILERRRGGGLHQSMLYRSEGGQAIPRQSSWYCGEDPVLQVRLREWVQGSTWRLPSLFDVRFPKAGLEIAIALTEIEGNPPPSKQPFRPQLGSEIRWTTWTIPQ